MEKLVLLLVCLTGLVVTEDPLRAVLRSPTATLRLYSDHKTTQHLNFPSAAEERLRFRLFRKNAAYVASLNEDLEDEALYGINMFSTMTREEKQQYLGLNVTGHMMHHVASSAAPSLRNVPSQKLWTNVGAVTRVTNQGGCGSCWTYGAVGGLETRYHQLSGVLRKFSEQEYLDCVYESNSGKDGCKGGWPDKCYEYSKNNGGRLAAAADYPYRGRDGTCQRGKPNALTEYKITGYVQVAATESANIEALASGSLSVAFEVTDKLHQYRGNIFKDTTCDGFVNHAVTAVGYTPTFVLVKNSWGSGWGDRGFIKFARGHHNCHLFHYSSYPQLTATGVQDRKASDPATNYRPDENDGPTPEPRPVCEDRATNCEEMTAKDCEQSLIQKYCERKCGICTDEEDCPAGTVRCPDGSCRHEHMC